MGTRQPPRLAGAEVAGHGEAPAPVGRFRPPSLERVAVLGLLVVALSYALQSLSDNSFLTHLATGRLILDRGSVPTSDPYSWTALGEPWVVQSWGASVLYAGIERTVGLVGIRVLSGLCVTAIVLGLWRLTRPAGGIVPRFVTLVFVTLVGLELWIERPLLLGAVFLVVLLLVSEDGLDPRWLVPVMWLWVNVHGSFVLGLGLLLLLAVGTWIDERARPDRELRVLAWAAAGTALAAVNPVGPKLLLFPLTMLTKREAFESVVEWQPPTWEPTHQKLFAVLLAATAVLVLLRDRRWRAALPVVAFGGAALLGARNIMPAAVVLAPVLARSLRGVGTVDGGVRRPALWPVAGALAAALLVVVGARLAEPDARLELYPEDLVGRMRDEGRLDREARLVAPEYVGNYLEARFGPDEVRVFVDDRVDMFPMDVSADYAELRDDDARDGGEDARVLGRLRATAVLWERDEPLGRWLDGGAPGWRVVDGDEDWVLAVPDRSPGP